jgi:hypothetical protein
VHPIVVEPDEWGKLRSLRESMRTMPIGGRELLPRYGRFAKLEARWLRLEQDPDTIVRLHHNNVITVTMKINKIQGNDILQLAYNAAKSEQPTRAFRCKFPWLPTMGYDTSDDEMRNFVVVFLTYNATCLNTVTDLDLLLRKIALLLLPRLSRIALSIAPDDPRVQLDQTFQNRLKIALGSRCLVAAFATQADKDVDQDNLKSWLRKTEDSLLEYSEDLVAWHFGLTYGLAKVDQILRDLSGPTADVASAERFLTALPTLLWNPGLYEEHSITAKWIQFASADKIFAFRYLEQVLHHKLSILQSAVVVSKLEAVRLLMRGTRFDDVAASLLPK